MDEDRRKGANICFGRKISESSLKLKFIRRTIIALIISFILIHPIAEVHSQHESSNFFESVQVLTIQVGNKTQPELVLEAVNRATINAFLQYFGSKYEKEIGEKFDQLWTVVSKDSTKFIRGYKVIAEKRIEQNYTVLLKISISKSVIEQIERELSFTKERVQTPKESKVQSILVLLLHIRKNSFDYWWKEKTEDIPLSIQERKIEYALRSLNYEPIMRVNLKALPDELMPPFLEDKDLKEFLKEAGTKSGIFIAWNEIEEDKIRLEVTPFSVSERFSPHSFVFDKKEYEASKFVEQLSLKLKHILEQEKKKPEKEIREIALKISNYKNLKTLQEILSFLQTQRLILEEVVPKEITAGYASYTLKTYYTKEEFINLLKAIGAWPTDVEILFGKEQLVEIHCLQGD